MADYVKLLEPLQVGNKVYKNRMVSAPIYCGTFINIPDLGDVLQKAMRERARGGAASVTIGETPVDFVGASREPFPPIDYTDLNDPSMPKFKDMISYMKAQGTVALIELSHCGESVEKIPGVEYGIGPMGYTRPDGMKVYAMDEERMQMVIDHFVQAAKWFREAGIDGVMIHTGHGWLLHQFLSPRTNHRSDEYGGSLENRARFPLMLLKAVREAMGNDFVIEIRVSGEECMGEEGMHVDETAAFCKMAEPYIDLINVSVGTYRNPILSGEFSSMFQEKGLNRREAKVIKEAVTIPISVVGGITSPEVAQELIAGGYCDLVALGRVLTADPEYPNKVAAGGADDIAECIRCFRCFQGPLEGVELTVEKMFGCSVNPSAFCIDREFLERKSGAPKKVLVVGGGVAGMTAAITACDRGHDVTLVESSERLGGLLFFTDNDHYKDGLKRFRDLLIRRVQERPITLMLNTKATPEMIAGSDADHIIIAVGSCPVTPDVQGVENAIQALDVYKDNSIVGQSVIILGGGLVGCETAIDLAQDGKDVTIVIRKDETALAKGSYPMHRVGLMDEMRKLVRIRTGLQVTKIRKDGITAQDAEGKEVLIKADTVVQAMGMKARKDAAETLKSAAKVPCDLVGDCVEAAKVYDAGRQAWMAAWVL